MPIVFHKFSKIFCIISLLALVGQLAYANPIIEKSPQDSRQYKAITLKNGMSVVVVSDPTAQTDGVALTVRSGSFDEPREWRGLAHYLEHMLFLGTKKYPETDEFQNYVHTHGGSYNAFTAGENTTFHFDVAPNHLAQALDRFAEFFISPTFNREMMAREINAVDSEYQMNVSNDTWRMIEVQRETSHPDHPFSQFSIGNHQTLSKNPEELHKALVKFYKTHYRADNMGLSIVGPQSIEELTTLAKQHFGAVANGEGELPARPKMILGPEQLGLDIQMQTVADRSDLMVFFTIMASDDLTREKAGELLATMMRDESRGGLSDSLKKQRLIVGMGVDYINLSEGQDSLQFYFSLTPKGLKKMDEITKQLFGYLHFVRANGVPMHFVKDTQQVNYWRFYYSEKQHPTELAKQLATDVGEVPTEQLLTQGLLLPNRDNLDPQVRAILAEIKTENMRRIVMDPSVKTDKVSEFYHAPYSVKKLNKMKMQAWEKAQATQHYQLPAKNPYVAQHLAVLPKPAKPSKLPTQIAMPKVSLWHHQDHQFNSPKGNISVNFISPLAPSAKNMLLSWMYTALINEELRDELYPATQADAYVDLYHHSRGMTVSVNGYSENQGQLLSTALKRLGEYQVSPEHFTIFKHRIEQNLANYQQMALYEKALEEVNYVLLTNNWHPDELLAVLDGLTLKDLNQFSHSFWQKAQAEMLVSGNYNAKQAKAFAAMVEKECHLVKKSPSNTLVQQVVKLPTKSSQVRAVNDPNAGHVVAWLLQNSKSDYDTLAKSLLLAKLVEDPFFQQLRTERQLGYMLNAQPFSVNKSSGLLFFIESPNYHSNLLLKEMRDFNQRMVAQLKNLNEDQLAPLREHLEKQVLRQPKTIDNQIKSWWAIIEQGSYEFDEPTKVAQAVKKVTAADLAEFSQQLLASDTTAGQLLIMSPPKDRIPLERTIASLQQFKQQAQLFPT